MNRKLLWAFVATVFAALIVNGYRYRHLLDLSSPPVEAVVPWDQGGPPPALPESVPVTDVERELVLEVEKYGEGIVFDEAGRGYIGGGGSIFRFTPDGTREVWATTGGLVLGHVIQPDGTHLACDVKRKAVLRFDREGHELGVVSTGTKDFPLRHPNDIALDSHGGFYVTDGAFESNDRNPISRIFYVDADGESRVFDSGLAGANGLIVMPDGKRLLVCEDWHNRIHEYRLAGPGTAVSKRVFADLPGKSGDQEDNQPDTICLDARGNVYVGHWGMGRVQVLDPGGRLIASYKAGMMYSGGLAFSPDGSQLYVSGSHKNEPDSMVVLERFRLPEMGAGQPPQ
ncbi:MAG: SMP-30/gluconolactonase/LRE family protein [Planctomycetales bacterium]